MSKDAQINPMELISGIGATSSALKDAFESKQASSCECASKRLDSCELNQQAYRNMLQSDSYSFEEKAQIHAWIKTNAWRGLAPSTSQPHANFCLESWSSAQSWPLSAFPLITLKLRRSASKQRQEPFLA